MRNEVHVSVVVHIRGKHVEGGTRRCGVVWPLLHHDARAVVTHEHKAAPAAPLDEIQVPIALEVDEEASPVGRHGVAGGRSRRAAADHGAIRRERERARGVVEVGGMLINQVDEAVAVDVAEDALRAARRGCRARDKIARAVVGVALVTPEEVQIAITIDVAKGARGDTCVGGLHVGQLGCRRPAAVDHVADGRAERGVGRAIVEIEPLRAQHVDEAVAVDLASHEREGASRDGARWRMVARVGGAWRRVLVARVGGAWWDVWVAYVAEDAAVVAFGLGGGRNRARGERARAIVQPNAGAQEGVDMTVIVEVRPRARGHQLGRCSRRWECDRDGLGAKGNVARQATGRGVGQERDARWVIARWRREVKISVAVDVNGREHTATAAAWGELAAKTVIVHPAEVERRGLHAEAVRHWSGSRRPSAAYCARRAARRDTIRPRVLRRNGDRDRLPHRRDLIATDISCRAGGDLERELARPRLWSNRGRVPDLRVRGGHQDREGDAAHDFLGQQPADSDGAACSPRACSPRACSPRACSPRAQEPNIGHLLLSVLSQKSYTAGAPPSVRTVTGWERHRERAREESLVTL